MAVLTEISLFTGAGGGVLASALLGHRIVCYVERDPYCVRVLQQRIADGLIDDAPIWDDVRTFDGRPWAGLVDVVSAGFPCQPFSSAGDQRAGADDRNGWPDTIRLIREIRPRFALLENVPGLLALDYARTVFGDLAEGGYDAQWDCIPAAALGAPQRRNRVWITAYAHGTGCGVRAQPNRWTPQAALGQARRDSERLDRAARAPCDGASCRFCRAGDAVARRVDRVRAAGNGQVPLVAATAYRLLGGE